MATLADYIALCKPRVVALMILTSLISMCLAIPHNIPSWMTLLIGNLGIALAAAAGGIINHLMDRHIDATMNRTKKRPIASGRLTPQHAKVFASVLAIISMFLLAILVNLLTALLSFLTLIGYAFIYTVFLKRATPQNIVIGGLAGAMPPLLGWTAVTGHIDPRALLLVLIIFTWTPPHFWSLAIYRHQDYAKANIPMLPVVYGIQFTKLYILLYTCLLIIITFLPYIIGMSGIIYLIGLCVINSGFLFQTIRMLISQKARHAMRTFHYSNFYLLLLFSILLVDHYWLYKYI